MSIIVLSLDKEISDDDYHLIAALTNLKKMLRETDIVGFADQAVIGILLPETRKEGLQYILPIILKGSAGTQFSVTSGTYPDQLFDAFDTEGGIKPNVLSHVLEDAIRLSPTKAALKRTVDILGAVVGIVISMPIMLVLSIAIKLTSPGPVIFKQVRLGRKGVPFIFYKFRSMYSNIDDRIHRDFVANWITVNHAKINQGDTKEPFYKIRSDPRVTRIGKIIRHTSLDELPQLFNVLIGDMSLVGPRPPLPYEIVLYQSWHLRRVLEIRPGITGLWQVEGRANIGFDDMVRLDLRYINQQSLVLDLKILFKTMKVVLQWVGTA
ncbi:MAG: sugar transferase [Methylococcales bacterium]